jgi:hypothetical protein
MGYCELCMINMATVKTDYQNSVYRVCEECKASNEFENGGYSDLDEDFEGSEGDREEARRRRIDRENGTFY